MRFFWGGRAFAVGGGERGALVSGDVEEGVEEEISDAFAQGGRLDKGGRPDGLAGARGVEPQHLLVPVHSLEALPYCEGGCGGRRWRVVRPVRQLVVRRVARVVVWAGGGWGWSLLLCAELGDGVCLGGRGRGGSWTGTYVGGGGGGGLWVSPCGESVLRTWGGRVAVALLRGGGWGYVLRRLGSWVSRRVLWVLCVHMCVGQVMRPLAGRGVGVGDGCLGFWVGLWFAGGVRLLAGGARGQGLRQGGW